MTPKYNPQKEVQRNPLYYHPTPESWFADVDYPNPHAQKQIAKITNPAKRQRRQSKNRTVIRFGRIRSREWSLIQMGGLLLLLKWIIFGF